LGAVQLKRVTIRNGRERPAAPRPWKIVVVGSSGHARVILDILRQAGQYEVIGLLDTYKPQGSGCSSHVVLGTCEDLPALIAAEQVEGGIVAIGDNWTRAKIAGQIKAIVPGFRFVTAVHPSARVAEDVTLGDGTVVMAGAILNPGCVIGESSIINTGASLDHESVMGDFSSLGPGVVTGGRVRIGNYTAIGIGAVVLQEITIGEHTVIGAGATVVGNVPGYVVAYGTPARVMRAREAGDPYLGERKGK